MVEGFAEKYGHLPVAEVAAMLDVSEKTVLRMRKAAGIRKQNDPLTLPADIEQKIAQGLTTKELAKHYGFSYSGLRKLLKSSPHLAERLLANARAAQVVSGRVSGRRKKPAAESSTRLVDFVNFEREKLVAEVTRAMRYLQSIRLGPCYPWKNGYYWMGKCLDETALMAEATKRGWVI